MLFANTFKYSYYGHPQFYDIARIVEKIKQAVKIEKISVAMSRSHKLITLTSNTTHKIV
jgi:hypothetical protein